MLKKNVDFENDDSQVDDGANTQVLSADQKVAAALAAKANKESAKPAETKSETKTPAADTTTNATVTSTSTAVAAPAKAGALAATMAEADPFKDLVNAIHVDYNTLTRIMVTNGNVQNKDTKGLMGPEATMELISIQSHWVMSPGGDQKDEESLEFLKFSDDGKTVRGTGELLTEARDRAIEAGYTKARINERLILVGMMVDSGKLADSMNGELVQMDLAPRSMANFNRHRLSTTFRIGKGLQRREGALVVKIGCEVKSEKGNNWTDAIFSTPA